MNSTSFKLSNFLSTTLRISLEPEGTILEIQPGDFIEIVISNGISQSIDMQLSADSGIASISLWPEKGDYRIYYKGVEYPHAPYSS
jgi:hypothetical protein